MEVSTAVLDYDSMYLYFTHKDSRIIGQVPTTVPDSEVDKLRSNTLRPTHKPLTRPVGDTVYTNKKCVIRTATLFLGTAGNVVV
jgi:hypothetical protein